MHLKFELILIYFKAAMDNIFSNSSHLEWKVGLSDTLLKGDHPSQIWFDIWFSGFRGEYSNVIVYNVQKMYNGQTDTDEHQVMPKVNMAFCKVS